MTSGWLALLHWRYPWAGLLVLVPLVSLLAVAWRQQKLNAYADVALRPWAMRSAGRARAVLRQLSHFLFWGLLSAAAAGPYVIETTRAKQDTGAARGDVNVLVLVDASGGSTDADTAQHSRAQEMERLHRALHDLAAVMQGERLGLLAYSSRADLVYPPSHDYSLLSFYFPLVKDVTPAGGASALPQALSLAQQVLLQRDTGSRAVIVLTRSAMGTAHTLAATEKARAMQQAGIALSVMTLRADQRDGYAAVVSSAGGVLRLLPGRRTGWADVYDDLIAPLPSQATAEGARRVEQEMFARFLIPALLFWCMGMIWRSVPAHWLGMALLVVIPCGMVLTPSPLLANEADVGNDLRRAYEAYRRADFAAAQIRFGALAGAQARLGEGAAAYRRGDYAQSARLFQQALLLAETDQVRADALFNLGNAWFRQERYALAMQSYYGVLEYRKRDAAAQHNLWQASRRVPALMEDSGRSGDRPGLRSGDGPARQDEVTGADDFVFSDLQGGGATRQDSSEAGRRVASGTASARAEALSGDIGASLYRAQVDTRAALKKLELIEDDPAGGLRALLEHEVILRQSPGTGSDDAGQGRVAP